MRLHEIAHQIDHLMNRTEVKPYQRLQLLEYIEAGYDENGERVVRTEKTQGSIRCADCVLLDCPEECPDGVVKC